LKKKKFHKFYFSASGKKRLSPKVKKKKN